MREQWSLFVSIKKLYFVVYFSYFLNVIKTLLINFKFLLNFLFILRDIFYKKNNENLMEISFTASGACAIRVTFIDAHSHLACIRARHTNTYHKDTHT